MNVGNLRFAECIKRENDHNKINKELVDRLHKYGAEMATSARATDATDDLWMQPPTTTVLFP